MGRGHGSVQRAALAVLSAGGELDSAAIADRVYGRSATPAEGSAVRRALRKLLGEGRVDDLGRRYRNGRRRWAIRRTLTSEWE